MALGSNDLSTQASMFLEILGKTFFGHALRSSKRELTVQSEAGKLFSISVCHFFFSRRYQCAIRLDISVPFILHEQSIGIPHHILFSTNSPDLPPGCVRPDQRVDYFSHGPLAAYPGRQKKKKKKKEEKK